MKYCLVCAAACKKLLNGECPECHEALKAHRYWTIGAGTLPAPEREPDAVVRGRQLSETARGFGR